MLVCQFSTRFLLKGKHSTFYILLSTYAPLIIISNSKLSTFYILLSTFYFLLSLPSPHDDASHTGEGSLC